MHNFGLIFQNLKLENIYIDEKSEMIKIKNVSKVISYHGHPKLQELWGTSNKIQLQ